jgi:hypothetical protein
MLFELLKYKYDFIWNSNLNSKGLSLIDFKSFSSENPNYNQGHVEIHRKQNW